MSSLNLYQEYSLLASRELTQKYSTSFSMGIRMLAAKFRDPICAIYGFVRIADEIVDTFPDSEAKFLLEEFRKQTFHAIESGISTNPVLQSFQWVVRKYDIDQQLIEAFLKSMEMDLYKKRFNQDELNEYVYGSAEVVGLMCLQVFVEGNRKAYQALVAPARALGSAFQKINFLRDLSSDYTERERVYFPGIDLEAFSDNDKIKIQEEIDKELEESQVGIRKLPRSVRFGVYLAFVYFRAVFLKIKQAKATDLTGKRYRISNFRKAMLLLQHGLKYRLGYF